MSSRQEAWSRLSVRRARWVRELSPAERTSLGEPTPTDVLSRGRRFWVVQRWCKTDSED